jgi:hypothetical protein
LTVTGLPMPSKGVSFSGSVLTVAASSPPGTYPLTFTATNSNGTSTQKFTLTVGP